MFMTVLFLYLFGFLRQSFSVALAVLERSVDQAGLEPENCLLLPPEC